MKKIVKRILKSIFVIYIIITLTFFIVHQLPNIAVLDNDVDDVYRTQITKLYHLDKPIHEQYGIYMKGLLKGDLGRSLKYDGRSVNDIIKKNFPVSLELALRVLIVSFLVAFPLGFLTGINDKINAKTSILISILIAIPSFVVIGFMQFIVVNIFNKVLGIYIPIIGFDSEIQKIMPTISLAIFNICVLVRIISKKIREERNKEYVEFALAKGLDMKYILKHHILKNIFPSILTAYLPYIISLITGSFITESLFGIAGLGRYYVSSVIDRDYSMIMGLTIFYAVILVVFLAFMDIVILLLDKRLKNRESV